MGSRRAFAPTISSIEMSYWRLIAPNVSPDWTSWKKSPSGRGVSVGNALSSAAIGAEVGGGATIPLSTTGADVGMETVCSLVVPLIIGAVPCLCCQNIRIPTTTIADTKIFSNKNGTLQSKIIKENDDVKNLDGNDIDAVDSIFEGDPDWDVETNDGEFHDYIDQFTGGDGKEELIDEDGDE